MMDTHEAHPHIDASTLAHHQAQLAYASPQAILRYVQQHWAGQWAVVTSFQPTGIVTLHMLRDIAPDTPILTLDTGYLFPQTRALIDDLEARWGLNVQRITPSQSVAQQAATYGSHLHTSNPDLCCQLRKVIPLAQALQPYALWSTGIRRDQSDSRADTPVISHDKRHNRLKVAPFVDWTADMIWAYIRAHDLPYNPLHDQGYPSIGCAPCTQPVQAGDDPRAGRWAKHAKTECGIHRDETPHR